MNHIKSTSLARRGLLAAAGAVVGAAVSQVAVGQAQANADPTDATVFDVSRFGGKGDGKTDCSAALLAAIAACRSSGGGDVLFPAGRWLLASPVAVSAVQDVRFKGTDGAQIICPDGADRVVISITASSGITFDSLRFVLPSSDLRHFYYGIHLIDVQEALITGCSFVGGASGLRVEAVEGSAGIRVLGCTFSGGAPYSQADKAAAAVAVGGGCSSVLISGNVITGFREEGIAVDGQSSSRAADPWVRDVVIQGNTVTGCGRTGINLRKVVVATVLSNTVSGCGNSRDSQLADGINVHTEERGAICTDVTIASNRVSECEAGIGVDDCARYTVTGNTVSGTTKAWVLHQGLSAQNSSADSERRCRDGVMAYNTVGAPASGWPAIAITHGQYHNVLSNIVDVGLAVNSPAIKVFPTAAQVAVRENTISGIVPGTPAIVTAGVAGASTSDNRIT